MTSASFQSTSGPARRTVVAAAGVAGLAVALTACGGSDDDASGSAESSGSAGSTGGSESASTGGGAAAGAALTTTADIPEGGGKVFDDQKVVVVQPTAGEFKAYSAVCTHSGCAVKSIADGVINCPCHNSNFSVTDGSVKSGPATKPLPEVQITVSGDSITLA
ncbi:Rieske (2Fe-2S) protein [Streptomyces phaeoluteigriseus]|uniref:Cytochrome bc1 complex Rieske iron-sulfur subunit n=1 Tax=Streptomyces phaeoluteigriseus TaxID=114686 RepID=A0A1V6MP60_9ACTN|nr:Rieske (2Fe-2S) protein [Streptomyces phaeoluteigriseus]OQD54122.1 Rieske (2Fe-2S) protein [Streptomyces phaeoluteigriseus]USQ87071.1 Rieske (2Fe-2S) protein [Streptomyces phaeoluteigriseus]